MGTRASGTFECRRWVEAPYHESAEQGGQKLARASVANVFRGDVEGEGTLEYLLVYLHAGAGEFMGYERVVGRLGERTGSLVLEHHGTFEGTEVRATWRIVRGSGTGELAGVHGEGSFVAHHGVKETPFTLEWEIA